MHIEAEERERSNEKEQLMTHDRERGEKKEKKCDSSLLIVRLTAEHNGKSSGAETDIDTLERMHTVSKSMSEQCNEREMTSLESYL